MMGAEMMGMDKKQHLGKEPPAILSLRLRKHLMSRKRTSPSTSKGGMPGMGGGGQMPPMGGGGQNPNGCNG